MRLPGKVQIRSLVILIVVAGLVVPAQAADDPLASWNDGPAKQAIIAFVNAATDQASPNYVPPGDRIATFDQDGTLYVEHPLYTQGVFALDRVHELAPKHPDWKRRSSTATPSSSTASGSGCRASTPPSCTRRAPPTGRNGHADGPRQSG